MLLYFSFPESIWVFVMSNWKGEFWKPSPTTMAQGTCLIETTGFLPIFGHACLRSPMRVTCMMFHEQEKEMGSINHTCSLLRRRRPRSNSRLYSDVGQTLNKCSWPSDEGQEATTPAQVLFRGLSQRKTTDPPWKYFLLDLIFLVNFKMVILNGYSHWHQMKTERLKAGEDGDRGWHGWMATLIQWTGTWANSRR